MKQYTPKRIWPDIPISERIDRAFLLTRGGAFLPNGEQWVEKHLQRLDRSDLCQAAVLWYASEKWNRCSHRVAPGEQFCSLHGGAKVPPPVKPSPDPQILIKRLERRHAAWIRKRDLVDEKITALA